MKKTFLLFMFCCITLVARAADAPQYFAIWLKNGHRIDLLLHEKPNVKYIEGTIKFEAASTVVEYNASDVKEFTLEVIPASGIKNMSAEGKDCAVSQSGNMLTISGAEPYARFSLYNAGGKLISTSSADDKGSLCISLNSLDHGVYILKIATTTLKIMKR